MKCIETNYDPHYATRVPNNKAAALVAAGTAKYISKQDYKATVRGRALFARGRQLGKTQITMVNAEVPYVAISGKGNRHY